jgi:cyclophilin family peptidyl-prolyl cis-trans isomerase
VPGTTLRLAWTLIIGLSAAAFGGQGRPATTPGPVVVLDTAKGVIEIELFAADAPKSTAHLLDLVRQGFYRGQRFHRVERSLIQVGDPASRNVAMEAYWGSGSSGHPIGVSEIPKKWTHVRGAVGLAYPGGADARFGDSQFYIMKSASPSLDGKYAVIGRVVKGMDVVDKIQRIDVLKNISVKGAGPK